MAREIDARGIPWWRALLLFPFVLGPRILLEPAGAALWRAAQRGRERWRERPSERRPPEPTGLGLFLLAFLFLGGALSIALAAQGVADRVAATGLMLVTLSTLFISPALLSLDALAKLDEWWLSTELPVYQLAFAHHFRRIVQLVLRLALTAVGLIFVLGAVDIGISAGPLTYLALPFAVSVWAAVVSGGLRLIVGLPSEGSPEPMVTASVAELQQDPGRQRRNTRLAALFFVTGTLLSVVAVVFLH